MCPECEKRGKTWRGDDPKCAFGEDGVFTQNNWNCATMNRLRDIAADRWNYMAYNDERFCCVPFDGGFICMTWYKQRGAVGNAIVMVDDAEIRPLEYKDVEAVMKKYEEKSE